MNFTQANEALEYTKTTLHRLGTKHVREHSGRTIQGKTVFQSRIAQQEFNSIAALSKIVERLTPETYTQLLNGQKCTIEAPPKEVFGEPDLTVLLER